MAQKVQKRLPGALTGHGSLATAQLRVHPRRGKLDTGSLSLVLTLFTQKARKALLLLARPCP